MLADDHGLSHGDEKKLTDALFVMARQGRTDHPLLSRIVLARKINDLCRTQIAPWDIDEVNDEWLEAIMAMTGDLIQIQQGLNQVRAAQDRLRAAHKRLTERSS